MVQNAPADTHDPQDEVRALRQGDLALLVALLLFCGIGIALTLQFPQFEERHTWPGILPMVLFVGLILMAVWIFVGTHLREPAFRDVRSLCRRCREGLHKPEFHRGLLVLGLLGMYIFFLLPYLPYLASTTIFVFISIMAFRAAPWWLAALVSILNSATLYVVFGKLYRIPLP
ncbi:MAG: tripartite tricarboxylate transporter TctB family protein [candidate division NC10 bacterium]|nr:tripartite tricarboxylate transporter TctB family protein [candidate division NC10 bacterium]